MENHLTDTISVPHDEKVLGTVAQQCECTVTLLKRTLKCGEERRFYAM